MSSSNNDKKKRPPEVPLSYLEKESVQILLSYQRSTSSSSSAPEQQQQQQGTATTTKAAAATTTTSSKTKTRMPPKKAKVAAAGKHKKDPSEVLGVKLVTELGPNDVLMGRGALATDYEGNLRLRELVHARIEDYTQAQKRNRKHQIAEEIVAAVKARGGRYLQSAETLKGVDASMLPRHVAAWYIVEDQPVLVAKVKQLLRDIKPRHKDTPPRPEQKSDPSQVFLTQSSVANTTTTKSTTATGSSTASVASAGSSHSGGGGGATSGNQPHPPAMDLNFLWQQLPPAMRAQFQAHLPTGTTGNSPPGHAPPHAPPAAAPVVPQQPQQPPVQSSPQQGHGPPPQVRPAAMHPPHVPLGHQTHAMHPPPAQAPAPSKSNPMVPPGFQQPPATAATGTNPPWALTGTQPSPPSMTLPTAVAAGTAAAAKDNAVAPPLAPGVSGPHHQHQASIAKFTSLLGTGDASSLLETLTGSSVTRDQQFDAMLALSMASRLAPQHSSKSVTSRHNTGPSQQQQQDSVKQRRDLTALAAALIEQNQRREREHALANALLAQVLPRIIDGHLEGSSNAPAPTPPPPAAAAPLAPPAPAPPTPPPASAPDPTMAWLFQQLQKKEADDFTASRSAAGLPPAAPPKPAYSDITSFLRQEQSTPRSEGILEQPSRLAALERLLLNRDQWTQQQQQPPAAPAPPPPPPAAPPVFAAPPPPPPAAATSEAPVGSVEDGLATLLQALQKQYFPRPRTPP